MFLRSDRIGVLRDVSLGAGLEDAGDGRGAGGKQSREELRQ